VSVTREQAPLKSRDLTFRERDARRHPRSMFSISMNVENVDKAWPKGRLVAGIVRSPIVWRYATTRRLAVT
jgi:hypothetical protein